jgi:hypothetical protein
MKIHLRGIGWETMDWMHLAQDRDQWRAAVDVVMNLRLPYKVGNLLSDYSFLRGLLHAVI